MNELPNMAFYLLLIFLFTLSSAHVLEGLKDAVLTAEGTIGDIFRTIDSVTRQLKFTKEAWDDSIEEDCKFSCKDGSIPKKNKYHKPSSNGCGVPGMEINTEFLPVRDMTKCCDQHDICYGTCNKDKDGCDLAFKKCLYKLCDNSKGESSESSMSGCKTAAKVLYSGTMMFGCTFYKTSQEEACYCPPVRKFAGDEF